jgi:flavin-dependent dehydrogenase
MKKILIVGGGTTGLTTALILKQRFTNYDISLVKSEKIGILGVGEAATEHWRSFIDYCDISYEELIKQSDATIKYGVKFKGFTELDYIHNTTAVLTEQAVLSQFYAGYAYHIIKKNNQLEMADNNILKNKISTYFLHNNICPTNQFHFNTFKLNEFLLKLCKQRNIKIYTDEIVDVLFNEKKEISKLKGKKFEYEYNFYIDCSGFQKVLISKLGAKWLSYKQYLKMNEAIAFPTKDTEEYPLYTTITAMNSGWMWQAPVYGRWGNGYVYDNNYMNAEKAKEEVENLLGHKIEIFKNIKFDPGCLDKVWINNCVALGISASFVEPMEASTISVGINQAFLLMHYLENYNQQDIENYNNTTQKIMENIRDFIFIHYLVKKNNTDFWKNIKNVEMPDSLKTKMESWKNRLPIKEDFKNTNYYIFRPQNFINVMYGLGLFDTEKIKKEYYSYSEEKRLYIENLLKNEKETILKQPTINHKQYLNIIRNNI